ncbi:MAG: shikimate kinase [Treponema sp.]|jgi:shikimate kinase|nr:shikimate kinase [Treponema sp.]
MGIVLLTGPKHSGKTSAGRALAALIKCPFIDLDALIEEREGKSPRELYREGPDFFRRAEAAALQSLLPPKEACVILAAGGGLCDNPAALELLKSPGISIVFLETSAETAWNRIEGASGGLPPFLDTENPRETHRLLHERRSAAYHLLAQIHIRAEGKSPEQIAAEIRSAMLLPGSCHSCRESRDASKQKIRKNGCLDG